MNSRLLDIFIGFILGLDLGLAIATYVFMVKVKATLDRITIKPVTPPSAQPPPPPDQDESVTKRLNQASELTRQQNDIMGQAQQPSQNALHSRHKNGLIAQYKSLETEKMGLLQSILKDGHDPLVTVFNATSRQNEEVKLSFFLNQFQPPAPPATTDTNIPVEGEGIRKIEKAGKTFYVIDGGKKTTQ